jgi:predicted secreted protein
MFHPDGSLSRRGFRMSNMKIISILDADQRDQDERLRAGFNEGMQFLAEELARLRERVAKLEEGVTPVTSG